MDVLDDFETWDSHAEPKRRKYCRAFEYTNDNHKTVFQLALTNRKSLACLLEKEDVATFVGLIGPRLDSAVEATNVDALWQFLIRIKTPFIPNIDELLRTAITHDAWHCFNLLAEWHGDVHGKDKNGRSLRHLLAKSINYSEVGQTPSPMGEALYILNALGAKRCPEETGPEQECVAGCKNDGIYDGEIPAYYSVPDVDKMETNLKKEKRFKERTHKQRLLCLDGGGIRGILEAQMLIYMEKQFSKFAEKPVLISDFFDTVAGSSAGGLIALALAAGRTPSYTRELFMRLRSEVSQISYFISTVSCN